MLESTGDHMRYIRSSVIARHATPTRSIVVERGMFGANVVRRVVPYDNGIPVQEQGAYFFTDSMALANAELQAKEDNTCLTMREDFMLASNAGMTFAELSIKCDE